MVLFPAIDLLDGHVVRLYQGDYDEVSKYGDDPAAFAKGFVQAGASHLHLVDLNGAKEGEPRHLDVVRAVAKTGLFVEFGGGVRNAETVRKCFEAGVGRVILGTAALRDEAFTKQMVQQYGNAIAIGVDAREGKVAVEGWTETSGEDSFAFCQKMREAGVQHIIYTDISRDGAGKGTNIEAYKKLSAIQGLKITASGGVSSLSEIKKLAEMDLYAAILGRALYNGSLKLEEALQAAQLKA